MFVLLCNQVFLLGKMSDKNNFRSHFGQETKIHLFVQLYFSKEILLEYLKNSEFDVHCI